MWKKNPSVKKYKKGKWFTIFMKIKYAKEVSLKIYISWEPIFSHYFRPFKLLGWLYKQEDQVLFQRYLPPSFTNLILHKEYFCF